MKAKKKEVDDTVPVRVMETAPVRTTETTVDTAPKMVEATVSTDWGKLAKDPDKIFPALMEELMPHLLSPPKPMPAYHVEYRRQFGRDSVSVNFSSETVDQLAATVKELQDKMPQPQPIDVLMPTVLIQPRKEEGKKT